MIAIKRLCSVGLAVILGLALTLLGQSVSAQTFTWDPNQNQSDSGGNWLLTGSNWFSSSGGNDTLWPNSTASTAQFGWGTGGSLPYTVTLQQATTAGGIIFQNQNYTLTGGGYGLTTGSGGIIANAPGTITAPIALGASQPWMASAGTSLSVSANVSGSYGLTLGARQQTYSSYLPTSAASAALLFSGQSLSNATSAATGVMAGSSVGVNAVSGVYNFVDNGTTASFELEFYDGTYTKVALIQLSQSGSGIYGYQSNAFYKSGNDLGTFTLATSSAWTANTPGSTGYGVDSTTITIGSPALGAVALSGSNSYTGGTNLAFGQLNINSATALGTGTFTISGGSINNTSGSPVTLSNNNPEAWNAGFTFVGSNPLNTGTGAVTLGLNGTPTVTVSGSTLTIGGAIAGPTPVGSLLASACGLTKAGTGTLVLAGTNTYGGATTISGGTLAIGGAGVLSSGASSIGNYSAAIAIANSAALVMNTSPEPSVAAAVAGRNL
jgi:autotransporter-associated beta strand protein